MTPEQFRGAAGAVIALFSFIRIPLLLGQEFTDDDPLIQDPIKFAVPGEIAFKDFKADNWKAFRALVAALTFQRFFRRFEVVLRPKFGTALFLVLFLVSLVSYVGLSVQKSGTVAEWAVVIIFGLVTSGWILVIEFGKALKRATTHLRVSSKN